MGGKFINQKHPGRSQYNFLNPDNKKGLVLNKERQWVQAIHFDFIQDNKKQVHKIDQDCQQMKKEIEQEKLKQEQGKLQNLSVIFHIEVPFKMARFTENAEPVYKNEELLNHEADQLAIVLRKEATQNVKDKYYIKRNIKTVIKMDRDQKARRSAD